MLGKLWDQSEKKDPPGLSYPQEAHSDGGWGHMNPWGKDTPHMRVAPRCHQVFTQGVDPGLESGKFKEAHSCFVREFYVMMDCFRR